MALWALAALAYLRYHDVLYPAFIQALLWAFITTLYCVQQEMFLPLSAWSYFVDLNGVALFGLGTYMATASYWPARSRREFADSGIDYALVILSWISILGLPFFVHRAFQLGSHGPTGYFFIDLRRALVEGRYGAMGILSYLMPISFSSAGLHVLFARRVRGDVVKAAISVVTAIVYSVFLTGRTFHFFLLLLIFGILLITRRVTLRIGGLLCASGMLLAFVAIAVFTGKGASPFASVHDNIYTLSRSFRVYLLGPLAALDTFMRASTAPAYGSHMFRTVTAVTYSLGFNTPPVPLVQPFTNVPMPVNVYTVYQPYFGDFAHVGAVLIQFFLGLWHGFLYRKADQGSPLHICLYALFLYPLCMQFFQDAYFNLLSTWVQFGLLYLLFFGLRQRHIALRHTSQPS